MTPEPADTPRGMPLEEAKRQAADLGVMWPEYVEALAGLSEGRAHELLTLAMAIADADPDPTPEVIWRIANQRLSRDPDDPEGRAWLALHRHLVGSP